MTTPWIIAGAGIIVVLAGYASFLCWKLWQQGKTAKMRADAGITPGPANIDPEIVKERRHSIFALACAIEEDALTLTEGCIRISAVASQLGDMESFNREFGVITRLAEETAHIPILGAWKELSKAEQKQFDQQREAIELKYQEAVFEAVVRIKKTYRT